MLTYEIKNGHAVVTGYELSATAEQLSNIEIPARYKLFKVTEIGPKAFCGCTQIESIMLPDTINTIGDSAFLCSSLRWIGCGSTRFEDKENGISCVAVQTIGKRAFCHTALEDVILQTPDSRLEVGEYAFADGRQLRNVVFQTADRVKLGKGCFSKSGIQTAVLPRNGALEVIPEECFLGCVQLRSVSFRDVRRIERNAFLGCKELRYLSLDGLEKIGDSAFNLCCSLKEVAIPDSCMQYARSAFQSAGIESFTVDPQNPMFCSENGVIFSKDKTRLLSFPPARGGSYMIPDGTIAIGEKAFYDSHLMDIGFPESLRVIEDNAFDGADNLVDVYLPDNIKEIREAVLAHCHKLYSLSLPPVKLDWEDVLYGTCVREIHFRGSKEEYDRLVTGELVNEPALFFLDTDGREYHHIARRGKTLQFEYSILSGGGVRIDKISPLFSKVVVPEMLEDHYVVEIAFGAFPEFTTEVFIPNTVQQTPDAFAYCAGALKHISIPFDISIEPATIPKDCVVERRI